MKIKANISKLVIGELIAAQRPFERAWEAIHLTQSEYFRAVISDLLAHSGPIRRLCQ